MCSKLTIKIRRSGVFIVNFERISLFSRLSIVDFERLNVGWVTSLYSRDK